jgi:branched-chain amino acid transport system permease protein
VIASGLTLIFGLMDVLNFGHGLFIAIGAYVAYSVLGFVLPEWVEADNMLYNIGAVLIASIAAMIVTAVAGLIFERVFIRKVYGLNLMQILMTIGGGMIGQQMLMVIWGDDLKAMPALTTLRGTLNVFGASIEKYRLFAMFIGFAVLAVLMLVLNRTKLGLLIRAGVQDPEMVEGLGYRIKTLFIGVFMAGSALAGLGGVLWSLYLQNTVPQIGDAINGVLLLVIIIGGLGSVGGSCLGALLLGLITNYMQFLLPKVGLLSDILLMVIILAWRPSGLYKIVSR